MCSIALREPHLSPLAFVCLPVGEGPQLLLYMAMSIPRPGCIPQYSTPGHSPLQPLIGCSGPILRVMRCAPLVEAELDQNQALKLLYSPPPYAWSWGRRVLAWNSMCDSISRPTDVCAKRRCLPVSPAIHFQTSSLFSRPGFEGKAVGQARDLSSAGWLFFFCGACSSFDPLADRFCTESYGKVVVLSEVLLFGDGSLLNNRAMCSNSR